MQNLITDMEVDLLVEYGRASEENCPYFNSIPEAYAIIKEEFEEATEEAEMFKQHFYRLWKQIRRNTPPEQILDNLTIMKDLSLCAAAEWIQVAAMCYKAKKGL